MIIDQEGPFRVKIEYWPDDLTSAKGDYRDVVDLACGPNWLVLSFSEKSVVQIIAIPRERIAHLLVYWSDKNDDD